MGSSRLYRFEPGLVKMLIPPGWRGTYIIYRNKANIGFIPIYVGRSDRDLRARLTKHPLLGNKYFFEFDTHTSSYNAFYMECALYHIFRDTIINKIHPASPNGDNMQCPFCNIKQVLLNRVSV